MVKDWELRYKLLYEAWMMEILELERNAKEARPQTKKYYNAIANTLEMALMRADKFIRQTNYVDVDDT